MELNNKVIAREYVEKNYIKKEDILKLIVYGDDYSHYTVERTLELVKMIIEENTRLENIEDEFFQFKNSL